MHAAVHTDDLDTLKALVKRLTPGRLTALLKSADKTGREPLHIAAYKCSEEMVKYLVEKGATANKEDSAGNTASKVRAGPPKHRHTIPLAPRESVTTLTISLHCIRCERSWRIAAAGASRARSLIMHLARQRAERMLRRAAGSRAIQRSRSQLSQLPRRLRRSLG